MVLLAADRKRGGEGGDGIWSYDVRPCRSSVRRLSTVEERRGWLFPIESVRLAFGRRTNNGSGELVRDVFGSVVARFIAPASLGLG